MGHLVAGQEAQEDPVDPEGLEDLVVVVEAMEAMGRVALVVPERILSLICQRPGREASARVVKSGGRLCRRVLGIITSLARQGSGSIPPGQFDLRERTDGLD
jgi:hypothetical protein